MRDILKTERLILRPPNHADARAIAKNINDKDILRMTASLPMPYFNLCADFWISQALANRRRGISYAYVLENANNELIGVVELFSNQDNEWEIGYWLAKRFWGQGLMSEAVKAILKENMNCLQADKIRADTFADNPASARLLAKMGFEVKNKSSAYSLARRSSYKNIEHSVDCKTKA